MSKYFPKLTQTEVFIRTESNGGGFNCPMLPVSALKEIDECSVALNNVTNIEGILEIRARFIALIKTVFPEKYHDALNRFEIDKLVELTTYLMYGDDDDSPRETSEKN